MKFTIAISAYKGVFLKECMDSILSQTFNDFELIILNDASPDNIRSVVESYTDSRIRYYENEQNVGALNLVDNWNKCLGLAKGDYFMQMGDDDVLSLDYLEEFDRTIKNYPLVSVLHCRSYLIDEQSKIIGISHPLPEWETISSAIYYRMNGRLQFISDFVFKTADLRLMGGFYKMPLAWFTDELTPLLLGKESGIANVSKPVFRYRTNRFSITSTGDVVIKLASVTDAYKLMKQLLEEVTPDNELDSLFIPMCLAMIERSEAQRKADSLSIDFLNEGLQRWCYWAFNRKKYQLGWKALSYSLYAYVRKMKHK
jgi:glycosyltransferase involved in cell wall biosynthesis